MNDAEPNQHTTYRISHTTTYTYETPVRVCHNLVMLTPRSDSMVRPLNYRVTIKPHPVVMHHREDYFGNQIHAFSIEENHRQLTVTASGRVDVHSAPVIDPAKTNAWNEVAADVRSQSDPRWLEACQFRFDSPRIRTDQMFANYASLSFGKSRPILEAAVELTKRIFEDFVYDTAATNVHTSPEEAFELRRGVCQDFAHVQIACLRSLGLSARYVSGYLRTHPAPGASKLVGADQSHAWLAIYCGTRLGWIALDPTNNKLANLDHIPIAWGRDYNDVVPVKGVFLGGGKHHVHVSVDVAQRE
ncbi:MAG: transglutaminase family protein [Pirellulaceae bacterium]